MRDLLDSGLATIRVALDRRDVSALELCEAYLSRYDTWEPYLNAFVSLSPENVLRQARRADLEMRTEQKRGALHGIPVAVKDNIDTKDERTTAGSLAYLDRVPERDAVVVTRLKAAGAIVFGKTNLPEIAYGPTDTYAFGPTMNPWRAGHYAGGSSMGSAAAVAAGIVPAALGTDTTGSIRNPAAWSGVTGLKPTYGLVPTRGLVPLAPTLDHIGPIARSAADCAVVLRCLAEGREDEDGTRLDDTALRSMRGGVLRQLFEPLALDVRAAVERAFDVLQELGVSMTDASLRTWDQAVDATRTILEVEAAASHEALRESHPTRLQPQILERLRRGAEHARSAYDAATTHAAGFRREIAEQLSQVDLLILPAREGTAPAITPDGARPPGDMGARYMSTFNLAGIPSLVLPCGFDDRGLPVGLQIAAAHGEESRLLRVAHRYQRETEWHLYTPALPRHLDPGHVVNTINEGATP